jgi:F0F1-type ATP synthase membrane subunit b/b'
MAQESQAQHQVTMTPLPRTEDLPFVEKGYDEGRVRDAFEAFRRHVVQLQAQLRVLQAAGTSAQMEPSGHAVRMDALHMIREAAEFADAIESDAHRAAAVQLGRTEEDIRRRQQELARRDAEIERYRADSERQRAEIVNAARNEARQLLADAQREANQELREAEARGDRLVEQARHGATELTNSARAEVEQTLQWARTQASAIILRAQQGAEGLLSAAGLGDAAMAAVIEELMTTAQGAAEAKRPTALTQVRTQPSEPTPAPEPQSDATPDESPTKPS